MSRKLEMRTDRESRDNNGGKPIRAKVDYVNGRTEIISLPPVFASLPYNVPLLTGLYTPVFNSQKLIKTARTKEYICLREMEEGECAQLSQDMFTNWMQRVREGDAEMKRLGITHEDLKNM